MAVVFVYNGHYILMVLSLNDSLVTSEHTVFDYVYMFACHIISSDLLVKTSLSGCQWMSILEAMNMVCIQ